MPPDHAQNGNYFAAIGEPALGTNCPQLAEGLGQSVRFRFLLRLGFHLKSVIYGPGNFGERRACIGASRRSRFYAAINQIAETEWESANEEQPKPLRSLGENISDGVRGNPDG
jgi:hypothetical protein